MRRRSQSATMAYIVREIVSGISIDENALKAKSVKRFIQHFDLPQVSPLLSAECPKVFVEGLRQERTRVKPSFLVPIHQTMFQCYGRSMTMKGMAGSTEIAKAGFFFLKQEFHCFWCDLTLPITSKEVSREKHMKFAPWCPFIRAVVGRGPTSEEREHAIRYLMMDPTVKYLMASGVPEPLMYDAIAMVYDKKWGAPFNQMIPLILSHLVAGKQVTKKADSVALACKVCLDNQIGVVFQPCGHGCACIECSGLLEDCPVCRAYVMTRHVIKLN